MNYLHVERDLSVPNITSKRAYKNRILNKRNLLPLTNCT